MSDVRPRLLEYQRVLLSLTGFNRLELEEIRRRASFLLQGKQGGGVGVEQQDYLLVGIEQVLRERGLEMPHGFRIRNQRSFAGYQTQSERVKSVLERAVPNMTAVQMRFLGLLAVRCLADYINSWSESNEVSLDSLLHNIGKIPTALEHSYPGYLEAGMYPVLIRREKVNYEMRK